MTHKRKIISNLFSSMQKLNICQIIWPLVKKKFLKPRCHLLFQLIDACIFVNRIEIFLFKTHCNVQSNLCTTTTTLGTQK